MSNSNIMAGKTRGRQLVCRNSESRQKLAKNPKNKTLFMDTYARARVKGLVPGGSLGDKQLGFLVSKNSVEPIR